MKMMMFVLCLGMMLMMVLVLCLCMMLMMVFVHSLHVLEDDDLVCIAILEDGVCSLLGTFLHLLE
jgi:hypothetical protein